MSGACLGHHLGHVWGIIWGMSGVSSGACLGHVWGGHHLGNVWGRLRYPRCYMHPWCRFLYILRNQHLSFQLWTKSVPLRIRFNVKLDNWYFLPTDLCQDSLGKENVEISLILPARRHNTLLLRLKAFEKSCSTVVRILLNCECLRILTTSFCLPNLAFAWQLDNKWFCGSCCSKKYPWGVLEKFRNKEGWKNRSPVRPMFCTLPWPKGRLQKCMNFQKSSNFTIKYILNIKENFQYIVFPFNLFPTFILKHTYWYKVAPQIIFWNFSENSYIMVTLGFPIGMNYQANENVDFWAFLDSFFLTFIQMSPIW